MEQAQFWALYDMKKTYKRWLTATFLLGLVVTWISPFVRSVNFMNDASAYYGETSSIDAANDLLYARLLLASYLSILVSGSMWAFSSLKYGRMWYLSFPGGGMLLGSFFHYHNVERPIVLMPDINPFILLVPGTVLTVWASWILCRNISTLQTEVAP